MPSPSGELPAHNEKISRADEIALQNPGTAALFTAIGIIPKPINVPHNMYQDPANATLLLNNGRDLPEPGALS